MSQRLHLPEGLQDRPAGRSRPLGPIDPRGPRDALPADRRLRVPVGLREHLPRRADGRGRVAVPPAPARPERLRDDPRPSRRLVPLRTRGQRGAGAPPVRPGHDGRSRRRGRRAAGGSRSRTSSPSARGTATDARSERHRRTPGDADARHVLLRTATCLHGSVDVLLSCEPSFDYGRVDARVGVRRRRLRPRGDDERGSSAPDAHAATLRLGIEGRAVHARHRLSEGESTFVALGWTDDPAPDDAGARSTSGARRPTASGAGGSTAVASPTIPGASMSSAARSRSRALTYAPTGALLAAPTTSLPEHPGGQPQLGLPLHLGPRLFVHAVGAARARLRHRGRRLPRVSRRRARARHRATGHAAAPATAPGALSGRRHDAAPRRPSSTTSRDTRAADRSASRTPRSARTSSTSSERSSTACSSTRSRATRCRERAWRIVVQAVETALECWTRPDHSIWESRGEPRHFTFSKVMCWVAADRGARLAALRGETDAREVVERGRARSTPTSARTAFARTAASRRSYGADELDAALLLLPLRALPAARRRAHPRDGPRRSPTSSPTAPSSTATAPRRTSTVSTASPRRSFTVCSFWLVSALVEIGELDRARTNCEKLIGSASALGLFGEELDPATTRHLGNFPQALTHLALVNAVLHVIEAEQQATPPSSATRARPAGGTRRASDDRPLHDVMTPPRPTARPSAVDDEQARRGRRNRLPVQRSTVGRLAARAPAVSPRR